MARGARRGAPPALVRGAGGTPVAALLPDDEPGDGRAGGRPPGGRVRAGAGSPRPGCVGNAWALRVVPPLALAQDGGVPERIGRRPGRAGAPDPSREESPMRTLTTACRHARYLLGSLAALSFGIQLN